MKRHYLLYTLALTFLIDLTYAQIETPRTSPKASISQMIGVCKITIDYCRPSVRDRIVFGDLIPFGKVWRTGADEATTITFNHDISIKGKSIPAGKYSLFTIPNIDQWTVILNKEWNQWGAYSYNDNEDIFRVELPIEKIEKTELCTLDFTEITKSSGLLNIQWDTTGISIPIKTNTHEQTVSEIENATSKTIENWFVFSAAAQYYFYERKNAEKAIELIDIAIAMNAPNPSPWMLKSQILAFKENYSEAIINANKAIEVSKNHDFHYEVEENEEQIKVWHLKLKE